MTRPFTAAQTGARVVSEPVGSWHVDGHNMAAVIRKTADGWDLVARCPNENASWREDARLMAAGPAMLNALRAALPVLMATENDMPRIAERRALVLDAIEKAEGKRP